MEQDWTGNSQSAFVQLGATSHSRTGERAENDYYATDPDSLQIFLCALPVTNYSTSAKYNKRDNITLNKDIWECAAGDGVLSRVLKRYGYKVKSSDIYSRGFKDNEIIDFLDYEGE